MAITILKTILGLYVLVTLPIMVGAFYVAFKKKRKEKLPPELPSPLMSRVDSLEVFISDKFADFGKDMSGLLQATKAITAAMIDIKNIAATYKGDNTITNVTATADTKIMHPKEFYINQLLFARDKYASNPTQKKTMNTIISKIQREKNGKQ